MPNKKPNEESLKKRFNAVPSWYWKRNKPAHDHLLDMFQSAEIAVWPYRDMYLRKAEDDLNFIEEKIRDWETDAVI